MRIVVADGNRATRYGVSAALRDEPDMAIVGEAEDGYAAIRLAQDLRPDVLVVDLSLARIRGLDVIRELAAALPRSESSCSATRRACGLTRSARGQPRS